MFSEARLAGLLEKEMESQPKALVEKIIENGAEQFDDITVIGVEYCR